MKAIRIEQYGGPDVLRLEDVEYRKPGPSEAIIRQHAIGVNYKDIGERSSGPDHRLPFTPGVEAAGVVEAVGDGVTELRVGDRVSYVSEEIGAYAEEVVVPAAHTLAGSLAAVRPRGYVVVYGSASGTPEPFQPLSLISGSRRLAGGNLFDNIADRDELLLRANATFDGIRSGFLRLQSVMTLPLAEAATAHRLSGDRSTIGKLVLTVGEGN